MCKSFLRQSQRCRQMMTEEMGTLSHCTVEDLYMNTSLQTSETGGRLGLIHPSNYDCAITAVWNDWFVLITEQLEFGVMPLSLLVSTNTRGWTSRRWCRAALTCQRLRWKILQLKLAAKQIGCVWCWTWGEAGVLVCLRLPAWTSSQALHHYC